MTRYNHFTENKYPSICFGELSIGDKFRMHKWKGNRRRYDIVMLKTGDREYREFKSGVMYGRNSSAFDVFTYKK